jgi:lipopolysaccharide/colanic/teichoic acid biosynthesis glycosyltransferase
MTARSTALAAKAPVSRRLAVKRLVDIVASVVGLVLVAPVSALIAIAVRLEDGGPVFYRQVRVGRDGRPFQIDKFRSMRFAKDGDGLSFTVAGDPRVTRVGAFLRRTKLDEMPQLLNVLRGEMSLVGPRPETPDLMSFYTPAQQAVMLSVRPGMTDYASLLLRDEGELLARTTDPVAFYRDRLIPLKCELCARYICEMGLMTDLRVVAATLWSVFRCAGSNPWLDATISNRFAVAFSFGDDDVS